MNNFQTITRSRSTALTLKAKSFFETQVFELLEENFPLPMPVRLVGVSISNLEDDNLYEGKQLTLNF